MAELHFKMDSTWLQPGGKWTIANAMYLKGKSFVLAALALREREGNEFVVLYCLCQGFEVMVKGLLLMKDYDRFQPQLKRIGHDLVKLANTAAIEFGLNTPSGKFLTELEILNAHYGRKQLLRYGTMYDILADPKKVPSESLLRTLYIITLLADPKISAHEKTFWEKPKQGE